MHGELDEMAPARRRRALLIALLVSSVVVGGIALADARDDPARIASPGGTVVDLPLATSGAVAPTVAPESIAPPATAPETQSVPADTQVLPPQTTSSFATAGESDATLTTASPAPSVSAQAFAVYDVSAQQWLAAQAADEPRAVGSLMKLLTAHVVLQSGDLSKEVTIGALDMDPMESAIGLYPGEQLPRDVLFRAMLIVSANDAARALAIDIGGSTQAFVDRMNADAQALGLSNTRASNPVGLDSGGGHSSARDMVMLAAGLMNDPTFREAVAKPSATLHRQTFPSTNPLLATYQGATGVKTGHTTDAGYCLVASATRDGRSVMVAVLGSPSESARATDAAALLDWAFASS